MSLAVAGLKEDEIKRRTKKLATGDWSDFAPHERVAFHTGYKLTKEPASFDAKDVKELTQQFGRHRAVDVLFYVAWGNYMTRVADAFQFPLERENPFMRPPMPK
jgi:hypothetical protein